MWAILNADNSVKEFITFPQAVTVGDIQYPRNIWTLMTPAELFAAIRAVTYIKTEVPEGKYCTQMLFTVDETNYTITENPVLADIVYDLPTVKAQFCAQVDALLPTKEYQNVVVNGIEVAIRNEVDFRNLNGLMNAALLAKITNATTTFDYRDAANAHHTLSADETIAMCSAVLAKISALYNNSWVLKDQINNATTAQEIFAMDLNTGW